MFEQEIVNLVEQVHPALAVAVFIAAVDTVVLVGINHQVELFPVGNHGFDEFHCILVVDVVVAATVTEQVVALNHRRVVDGRIEVVAIGIFLRRAHETLGIDIIVIAPVGHRSHRNGSADDIRALGDAVGSHKAAVAPAVDAYSASVNVGLLGHVFGKGNHVFGLVLAKLQVGHLLEHLALRTAATVVDGNADNAVLRKQLHPPIIAVGP